MKASRVIGDTLGPVAIALVLFKGCCYMNERKIENINRAIETDNIPSYKPAPITGDWVPENSLDPRNNSKPE